MGPWTQGKKRKLGFFWMVAGLLPFTYASSYAALGPTPAEGCSGAGSDEPAGVTYLSGPADAHVGSDAFFPFNATTLYLDAANAVAAIVVEVRDAKGELVPGTLQLLTKEEGTSAYEYLTLGWSADARREDGEELSFHAAGTNTFETETLDKTLTVVGVEPKLTLPSFDVTDWAHVQYDGGSQIVCQTLDDCGGTGKFGSELRDGERMRLEARKLTSPVAVAWEFEWVELPGKGSLVSAPRPFGPQSYDYQDEIVFTGGLDEYCVSLHGRDLHTGDTLEQELCATPSGDTEVSYDGIMNCSEPPAGYLARWCLAVDESDLGDHTAECEPYRNPKAGSGGGAGEGGATEPGSGRGGSGGAGSGSAGKGAHVGGSAGAAPSSTGGTGAAPPQGDVDGGAPPEDHARAYRTTLTKSGCACRVTSSDEHDSALACVGVVALAFGLRTRRRIR